MQKRKFDELISYFNRKVADMDIDTNYKMELLGMVTALGYAHEKETEERKKGKWIDYTEDGYVECPFCHSATNCDGNKDELHFCFSCGADMREDGEKDA